MARGINKVILVGNLGKDPEEPFYVRLVDAQGRSWAEGQSSLPASANPPVDGWRVAAGLTASFQRSQEVRQC